MKTSKSTLERLKAGEQRIVKAFPAEVKAEGDASNRFRFVISTQSVDRDHDVISAAGWRLDAFLKNPVVLWAHDYGMPPVAVARSIEQTERGLTSDAEFVDGAVYPFAGTVVALLRMGALRATSVGFRPMKWMYNEERRGVDFDEQELLEYSIVPVPANAECLIEARAAGIDVEPLREWAAKTLERLATGAGSPAAGVTTTANPAAIALTLTENGVARTYSFGSQSPRAVTPPPTDRKSYQGYQQFGFTAPSQGATAPVHVHDYALYVYTRDSGETVFEGGMAYGVADHSHRITAESLQRGETEAADGHTHRLMRAEELRAALDVLAKKPADHDQHHAADEPCSMGDECPMDLGDGKRAEEPCPMGADCPMGMGGKAGGCRGDGTCGTAQKRGRVLSAKNESKLKDAHAAIGEVLAQVAEAPEEESATAARVAAAATDGSAAKTAEDIVIDPDVIDLETIDLGEPDVLSDLTAEDVTAALRAAVATAAHEETDRALRVLRGRID